MPDGQRTREGGDAEPEHAVGHRREVGRIEHAVGAHPRIEVFVERLDADDSEHDAEQAAPEDGTSKAPSVA